MASVAYYVVTFDRDRHGKLNPSRAQEVSSADAARQQVMLRARFHKGIVAFSRTSDTAGEYEDGEILSQAGDVDLDALTG